jgi:hypothetical protein
MIEMMCAGALGEVGGCWSAEVWTRDCLYGVFRKARSWNEVPV